MKKASLTLCLFILIATSSVAAEAPEVVVEVNPNLELFAAVYILAFNGSDPFVIALQSCIRDVLTYFDSYRDHPAVHLMRETIPKDLPHYMRDYSINGFAAKLTSTPYLGNMSENDPILSEFYRALVSFAKESNFTIPLKIKVETDKGSTVKRIWVEREVRASIECEGNPVAVILDPHEWVINKNMEYQISGVKIVIEWANPRFHKESCKQQEDKF